MCFASYAMVMLWLFVLTPLGAATIAGHVADQESKTGVSNAVIWAEPPGEPPSVPPPPEHAVMAQTAMTFVPHVLPILAGTTVEFPNQDTVYHNVYSLSRRKRFDIGLYQPGESRSMTFREPGLVKIFCNIHDFMGAFILVLPSPYFTVSDAKGEYAIANIPPERYSVKVWHEKLVGDPREVNLTGSAVERVFFALSPRKGRME
ncbi:MAG: methylamine utilization protein [Nitrospinae bacterium]|nr:methylamine utilization protein [Nitrospinota bacterium]